MVAHHEQGCTLERYPMSLPTTLDTADVGACLGEDVVERCMTGCGDAERRSYIDERLAGCTGYTTSSCAGDPACLECDEVLEQGVHFEWLVVEGLGGASASIGKRRKEWECLREGQPVSAERTIRSSPRYACTCVRRYIINT